MSGGANVFIYPIFPGIQAHEHSPVQVIHLNIDPMIRHALVGNVKGPRVVLSPGEVVKRILGKCLITRGSVPRIALVAPLALVALVEETVLRCLALGPVIFVAALRVILTVALQPRLRVALPGVLVARARAALVRYRVPEEVRLFAFLAVVTLSVVLAVLTHGPSVVSH